MTNENLRMQMLAGVITESEYKAKLQENKKNKKPINEHFVAGGIVGVGAINNPFEGRKKTDYELAFEHFLGERYETKFENREQDLEEDKDSDVYEAEEMEEGWKVKSSKEGESSPEHYDYTEYEWVDDEEEDLDEGKEVEEPNNY
jgi:hypothetical protein